MNHRQTKVNVLDGSITKNLLILAWPVLVGMFLQTSFNIVDTYFIGKINPFALAGIGLSFPVMFCVFSLAAGLSIGGGALIAQGVGAKRFRQADQVAEHLLVLAFVISLVLSAIGIIYAEPIFRAIGADDSTIPYVLDYIKIIFLSMPFIMFTFAGSAIMQAEGDTKTPMKIMGAGVLVNIVLDPIFIFGWGIVPPMGVKGAALATAFARGIALILIFHHFAMGKSLVKPMLRGLRLKLSIIRDILYIGVPASLTQLSVALWLLIMNYFVSGFGPYAVAAFGVGLRVDSFGIMLTHGLAAAVLTIVGQNIGAGNYRRAEKTVWKALGIGFISMQSIGFFFMAFSYDIISVFNDHPDVISIGGGYLWIMGLVYVFPAIMIIISSAFQGAGDSRPGMIFTIFRVVIIAVPGAIILSKIYGLDGIWYAMAGSGVITGAIALVWFKVWIRKKARTLAAIETPQ
ncbi:MAG: MATE family efflux transporter [Candidatus Altiarchaeota archaeon]